MINFGKSNTRFQFLACMLFKRKYGDNIEILFTRDEKMRYEFKNAKTEYSKRFEKLNNTQSQSLISMFGDLISSLVLCVDPLMNENYIRIENFKKTIDEIAKCSFEALVKMECQFFPRSWLNKFFKTPKKVEYVELWSCDLSDDTVLLSEIFPKLNHLGISYRNSRHDQIITHFPYLKTLALRKSAGSDQGLSSNSQIKSLFKLNRQISTCILGQINGKSKLIKIITGKLRLERLGLYLDNPPIKKIHFKTLKQFTYRCEWDPLHKFPFKFDELKALQLLEAENIRVDDIIKQNGKLVELSLKLRKHNFSYFLSQDLGKLSTIVFDSSHLRFFSENWEYKLDEMTRIINEKPESFATNIKFRALSDANHRVIVEYLESNIDKKKWELACINGGRSYPEEIALKLVKTEKLKKENEIEENFETMILSNYVSFIVRPKKTFRSRIQAWLFSHGFFLNHIYAE